MQPQQAIHRTEDKGRCHHDHPDTPADAADTTLNGMVQQRFPLLPRSKPVCRSLTNRIDRVRYLASRNADEALLRAAEAHNLAALIASDCGMPALARDLCWRQFELFATSGPYGQTTAKLTLQPLINLGRLHTRDGNGTAAYQLHEALLNAARTRTQVRFDGKSVSFEDIVKPGDDHRGIVRWLWTILLADGIRALCRAGRWVEALYEVERHNGIGQRLLDGRQVAIITQCAAGDYAEALRLLAATSTPTPWEKAVAACLKVICLTWAQRPADLAVTAMVDTYLSLLPASEHAVFQVRLGLTVADLANNRDIQPVAKKIERTATDAADAYAARDVLTSTKPLPLSEASSQALRENVTAAGLGTTLPPDLLDGLIQSVRASEATLALSLADEQR